ncbi:MAG: hypothetical protein NTX72_00695 [Candidatus Uhrbacteria bacterium]|nr:hypothetical protein [Candidatus Uhrbacteria bacterium]
MRRFIFFFALFAMPGACEKVPAQCEAGEPTKVVVTAVVPEQAVAAPPPSPLPNVSYATCYSGGRLLYQGPISFLQCNDHGFCGIMDAKSNKGFWIHADCVFTDYDTIEKSSITNLHLNPNNDR